MDNLINMLIKITVKNSDIKRSKLERLVDKKLLSKKKHLHLNGQQVHQLEDGLHLVV